jgi:hypothetical protein
MIVLGRVSWYACAASCRRNRRGSPPALGAVLCGGLWIPLIGMAAAMLAVGGILVAADLAIATFRPGEA